MNWMEITAALIAVGSVAFGFGYVYGHAAGQRFSRQFKQDTDP